MSFSHNLWTENEGKRGSEDVTSCINDFFKDKITDNGKTIIAFCDSCGGQNRNYNVARYMLFAVNTLKSVDTIEVNFMESGHSFLPNDSDFSNISDAMKSQSHIYVPEEYENLIKYYLNSGKDIVTKANNIDGLTGFQYSYVNKKYLAMEMLITHPSFLNAKSEEVGCIFEEVCFRGNVKVVQILLKHRDSKYMITAKDGEDKTGFIRACQMGREEVADERVYPL